MLDITAYVSMALFGLPIILGVAAWGAIWVKDHFYETPFYEDHEYEQNS